MEYRLPSLPYDYGALEPYIDTVTMEIHHTKHHQGYVNILNNCLETHPELQNKPLTDLLKQLNTLPDSAQASIRNNGGGHYNHSLFWQVMKKNGGGEPKGHIGEEIKKTFGNFQIFQDHFNATAKTVFGSGWAWLCVVQNGELRIMSTLNQDSPLSQNIYPILGLDVWEHAYYLKYQNRRPDYINAWWHVINWEKVEENYRVLF
ncbi:superoxide dismutase [Candidatus Dependentiae bacterium]|nr:superoxide dismutase [Candidatus Dependentiae bacterium]